MTTPSPECDEKGYPFHPRGPQMSSILLRLNQLRNELDHETFLGPQEIRSPLYLLNDCIEALEIAVQ